MSAQRPSLAIQVYRKKNDVQRICAEIRTRLEMLEAMMCSVELVDDEPTRIDYTLESVSKAVCDLYEMPFRNILGRSRASHTVECRFVCWWVIKTILPHYSTVYIGEYFGNRDHGAVINGLKRISAWRETDPSFRSKTDKLMTDLKAELEKRNPLVCEHSGSALSLLLTGAKSR